MALKLRVHHRIAWLGYMTEEEKRALYAQALGVIFPPADEDYGYVTLEAMLASKPVVTCTDSGGPLEFIREGKSGLMAESTAEGLATAMNGLWANRAQSKALREAGRKQYESLEISWRKVVERLLS
jgi:glycosyltransferase involved in cell wall biosynthesis